MPTLSVHVDAETYQEVSRLAEHLDRSRSWIVGEAIAPYLEHQAWLVASTKQAQQQVRDGSVDLVDHAAAETDILAYCKTIA